MYTAKKIGQPSRKEGSEGDIVLRKDFGGESSIYGKVSGIWEKIGLKVSGSPLTGSVTLFDNKRKLYHNSKLIFRNNTFDVDSILKLGKIDNATTDTDKFLVSDGGTIKYRTGAELVSDLEAGVPASLSDAGIVEIATAAETNTGSDATRAVSPDGLNDWTGSGQIVGTGALNSGSITSGFGNIDVGSSTIDTTGNVSVGDLQVNGNDIAFDAAASTISIDAAAHDTAGQALTISAGDTTAGTTNNIAGGSLIFQGGQGKGSGAGGSIVFSVADGGSSGSSLNSLVTALTIDDNKDIICNGGPLHVKAPSGGSADLFLIADDEEDNPDIWRIRATDSAASNVLSFSNKISGSQVTHFTISPHATVTSSNAIFAGNVAVNGTSGITAGAVIWQSFPFILSSATNGRYYFIDTDDTANSYRKWDAYDTSPTAIDYRGVAGQFVVPENCTLVAMHGVIANTSSTNDPSIYIYHGSITEGTGTTTLASAGDVTPSIGTTRVPYKFSKEDFDADLSAGDIVVPMIVHADTGGTRNFQGSLTLKFITR